jgi:hypothetical protein
MRPYINNTSLEFDKDNELMIFLENCVYEYFTEDAYETFIKSIKNEGIEWTSIIHVLHHFHEWKFEYMHSDLLLQHNFKKYDGIIVKLFEEYISMYITGENPEGNNKLINVFVSLSDLDSKDDDCFLKAILNLMLEKEDDFQICFVINNMINELHKGASIGKVLEMQSLFSKFYNVINEFKAENIHGGCYNERASDLH